MSKASQRVMFFNRYYWPSESATSQLLTDLATALAASGYDVSVVASGTGPKNEQARGVRIHRLGGTRESRLLLRAFAAVGQILRSIVILLIHCRRGDTVVAMTDPPLLGSLLQPFARLRGARVIHWWQDVYPEIATTLGVLKPDGIPARLLRRLRDFSLRRDIHVAISEDMAAHLRSAGAREIHHIANWSPDLQAPAADVQRRRTELGLEGKTVFGYCGNLGLAHEFDTWLTAAEALRDRPDLCFLIIGTGAREGHVREQAQTRQLTNWRFLPAEPRAQLAVVMGVADVQLVTQNPQLERLVFPSKIQGVLAAARPCLFVGDTQGEVARLLHVHECGVTVQSGDAATLAERFRELAENPALRQRLGANARRTYELLYRPEQALNAWRRILDAR